VTHSEASEYGAVHVRLLATGYIAVSVSYQTDLRDSGDFPYAFEVMVTECRRVIVGVHDVKNPARCPARHHDRYDAGGCDRSHVLGRASTSLTLKMGMAGDFCSAGVSMLRKVGISIDHHDGLEKHRNRQQPGEETVPGAAGLVVGHHAHAAVPPRPSAPCADQVALLSTVPSACLRRAPDRDCL